MQIGLKLQKMMYLSNSYVNIIFIFSILRLMQKNEIHIIEIKHYTRT